MHLEVYKNIKQTWINSLKIDTFYDQKQINWSKIILENENCYCVGCFTVVYDEAKFEIEHIEGYYETMLGYDKSELSSDLLLDILDKNDLTTITKFEKFALIFFSDLTVEEKKLYSYKYDACYQKKNGEYIRLQKEVQLKNVSQNPIELRLIEKYSDISSLKKEGPPSLCFTKLNESELNQSSKKEIISPSEKKVLLLLIKGFNSKQIAEKLFLSKETVDTHRKNMIKKQNVSNTSQLIAHSLINQLLKI